MATTDSMCGMTEPKTPHERFVEAQREIVQAHDEATGGSGFAPGFLTCKAIDAAAYAFADQECEADDSCWISEPFGMPTEDHEGHRASLRAEIRGDKP